MHIFARNSAEQLISRRTLFHWDWMRVKTVQDSRLLVLRSPTPTNLTKEIQKSPLVMREKLFIWICPSVGKPLAVWWAQVTEIQTCHFSIEAFLDCVTRVCLDEANWLSRHAFQFISRSIPHFGLRLCNNLAFKGQPQLLKRTCSRAALTPAMGHSLSTGACGHWERLTCAACVVVEITFLSAIGDKVSRRDGIQLEKIVKTRSENLYG